MSKKISRRRDHKLEKRQRQISYHVCRHRGCALEGKEAQQGVCFHREGDLVDWGRLAEEERQVAAEIAHYKKKYGAKKFWPWLQAMYECSQINWMSTLDECVRLRRDKTRLEIKLRRLQRAAARRRRARNHDDRAP